MSVKMKGLMKGFKYIEKFFDEEEKEKEISIGFPTDVKHVAHIGFDGPSASSPSWMNDFKGNESENSAGNNDHLKGPSQDASPKKLSVRDSPGRDLPGLPRSRRQASTESVGSIDSNGADSPKQSKSKASRKSRQTKQKDNSSSPKAGDASSLDLPSVPKKSRRKKTSKDSDSSERRASRSKEKGSSRHGGSRHGSDDGSISKHSFVEEPCPSSTLSTLNED